MYRCIAQSTFLTACLVSLSAVLASVPAEASHCSTAAAAGRWAYTYTGTIFSPSGPLPAASVGHFTEDADGNLTGSQTRSVAGSSGVEDIAGTVSVQPRLHRHSDLKRSCERAATAYGCTGSGL
jgi:hypothetical protein